MNDFKISYHNVDLDIIQKKLNESKKKVDKISKSILPKHFNYFNIYTLHNFIYRPIF